MKKPDEKEIESIIKDMQCDGTPSPFFLLALAVITFLGIGFIFYNSVSA